jgi:hypothetical protein
MDELVVGNVGDILDHIRCDGAAIPYGGWEHSLLPQVSNSMDTSHSKTAALENSEGGISKVDRTCHRTRMAAAVLSHATRHDLDSQSFHDMV